MKYEVDFLHKSYVNHPGSWLAVTRYKISAKNLKEARLKAINKFKARNQLKRFINVDYQVTIREE